MTQTTTHSTEITGEMFHPCPECRKFYLEMAGRGMATISCSCGHKLSTFLANWDDWYLAADKWNAKLLETWEERNEILRQRDSKKAD